MKKLIILIALTSVAALAQSKRTEMVKAAEKAWSDATCKGDKAALEKILLDELIYTHSNGESDSKKVFIDNLSNGTRTYHKVDYESMDVRDLGNTAVLSGVGKFDVTTRGQRSTAHLKFLHVFVFRNGQWQLAAHQSLRLPN